MRAAFAVLAFFPALALATIKITGPNADDYWVQNMSKTITWTYSENDPTPITILVDNDNDDVLNGIFTIEEFVDVALKTYTVTNVTLKNGTGYTIQFANPNDLEEVYAQGPKFEVKVAGTPPATSSSSNNTSNSSNSGNPSSSSSRSPSSTSSSSSPTGTGKTNGGVLPASPNILLSLAACGFVAVASIFV